MTHARATECQIPVKSALYPAWAGCAHFKDAYRMPLADAASSVTDIFTEVFGHHPWWIKAALIVRNRIARWAGLAAPTTAAILHPNQQRTYTVGETIGVWPIYSITAAELIAGRDNDHLNFRLSILRELDGPVPSVVISTACVAHNRFGRVYLWIIKPFHRWGVRHIMHAASRAGRL